MTASKAASFAFICCIFTFISIVLARSTNSTQQFANASTIKLESAPLMWNSLGKAGVLLLRRRPQQHLACALCHVVNLVGLGE